MLGYRQTINLKELQMCLSQCHRCGTSPYQCRYNCEIAKSVVYDSSDLSSITSLKQVILNSFSPLSEEVKSAASYTLGSVAVGNLPQYLPFVLQEIEAQPKRQYLLLHSLKEVSK
jgi:hypothetical protein